jgi:hypothetical protein
MYAGEWKFGCSMIERRRLPCGGRVTGFTNLAETSGGMVWIRRTLEIRGMTLITVRIHQFVIAAGVTRNTGCRNVRSCQRKFRRAVVEWCGLPRHRRMTRLASLTEGCRNVAGVHCPLEIRGVTLVAVRVHELIIAIGMTRLTRDRGVRARQCELRCAMIKCRRLPCSGGMARFTSMIEQSSRVIGICCFVEISLVAGEAGAR